MYLKYQISRQKPKGNDMDFTLTLKVILEKERSVSSDFLEVEDIDELLRDEEAIIDEKPRDTIFGFPTRPLYREIGHMLQLWMDSGKCPVLDLPTSMHLLDENEYVDDRQTTIEEIGVKLERIKTLGGEWSEEEKVSALRNILQLWGKRGLLDLLGMRKTAGTCEVWPPARRTLLQTFGAKHKPKSDSILTVGARALAKHFHRDQSSTWWGVSTGTETDKNKRAQDKMEEILDTATWLNIHQMVHEQKIIEARQADGYGVRWSLDGSEFRGFLEPQMEGGHQVGWRH